MAIDLRTPYKGNLQLVETDTQLTVGNKTLDADEVRCVVWRLAERHGVIVIQDEATGFFASFVAAVQKGTLVPASRALVAALKHGMGLVGIKQIAKGDLSKMPRRDGTAPAARARTKVSTSWRSKSSWRSWPRCWVASSSCRRSSRAATARS